MSEQADVKMEGGSPQAQHPPPANDSSNAPVDSDAGERASKRLKMEDSALSQAAPAFQKTAPGEGQDNVNPIKSENGHTGDSNTDSKPDHVDGRVKGLAPIKKE